MKEYMEKQNRTEISELGEFGLIDELTSKFENKVASTVFAIGDDAAVINSAQESKSYTLLSTDLLMEGIHFDLTYFPFKHLGYKTVVVGCNDIYAMNGKPTQITIGLAISSKISVEQLKDFYEGVQTACEDYSIDLVGGDTSASLTGLAISISTLGEVDRDKIVYRSGAKLNDLICITGDLGAAYMGLQLLEREKRVLDGHPDPKPVFDGYEYILRSQLKPLAQRVVIESLDAEEIIPTSMIDLSDGLSSDIIQICKSSKCGARIYLDRIPIAKETYKMAEELNADPVVAALNGGDDHKILFTIPLEKQDLIAKIGGIDVVGHITEDGTGAALVTPDGSTIEMQAQGFVRYTSEEKE